MATMVGHCKIRLTSFDSLILQILFDVKISELSLTQAELIADFVLPFVVLATGIIWGKYKWRR